MSTSDEFLPITQALEIEASEGGSSLSRTISKAESSGRYTGARLAPGIKRAALILLREGFGPQEVADELGIHFYTVQALQGQSPEIVAVGKKTTARLAGNVGRKALEQIAKFQETHSINSWTDAQRAAMIAGITIDKAQLLDGEPTEIVKHDQPTLTDAGEFLADLLGSNQPVQAVGNIDSKGVDEGAVSDEMSVSMQTPDGLLIAASRRVVAREADKKADTISEVIDLQGSESGNQLINNQSEGSASAEQSDEGTSRGGFQEGTGGGAAR